MQVRKKKLVTKLSGKARPKNRMQRRNYAAGDPTDKQPLPATDSYVKVDGKTKSISNIIDRLIASAFQNGPVPDLKIGINEKLEFQIINKDKDELIEGMLHKQLPTFSYQTKDLSNRFEKSEYMIGCSINIPLYSNYSETADIVKVCNVLTFNALTQKIQGIADKYKERDLRYNIFRSDNDHNDTRFVFLHRSYMIYANIDMEIMNYGALSNQCSIRIRIYYVLPANWTEFFLRTIKSHMRKNVQWVNYHNVYDKIKFDAFHRSAAATKTSPKSSSKMSPKSSSAFTFQSLPVELIDMIFHDTTQKILTEQQLANFIASYSNYS